MKDVYTLADLENFGRKKSKPPIRLGVLGHPVAHSRSPQMQNAALEKSGLEMSYARFEIAPGELQTALELLTRSDFVGVNLTVPHKITALALVNEVDESARLVGAVNTIKVEGDKLRGFNTDGSGFSRAIPKFRQIDFAWPMCR